MSARHLQFVPKRAANNAADRTIEFLISSGAEDRAGDTVNPAGWVVENYLKNPVVLWGHDRDEACCVIGKCIKLEMRADGLYATAQFATADENPMAETVYKLLLGGYLNAVSVGFMPLEYKFREGDSWGIDYLKQELLEFSVVTIPCNPEALTTARGKGLDLAPLVSPLKRLATAGPEADRARYTAAYLAASGLDANVPKQVHDQNGVLIGEIRNGSLNVNPDYQKDLATRNAAALARVAKELRDATERKRRRLKLMA